VYWQSKKRLCLFFAAFNCKPSITKKAPGGDTRGFNGGSVDEQEPLIDELANEDLALTKLIPQ
jgi:hypothetical protein